MPPKRAQRSRSRQTTPQSPPKSISTRTSPRLTRQAVVSKSPIQNQQSKSPLPAVDEESVESEDESSQPSSPSISPQLSESAIEDQNESDNNLSGTDSNGTTQLEALDADLISDNLDSLYHDALQVLSLFDDQDILQVIRDIHDPLSKTAKRLRNFTSRFNASREAYGENAYINIGLILRKVTKDHEITRGPWRPDGVLQLANLAQFIQDVSSRDENVIFGILERMWHTFPEPFINVADDAHHADLQTDFLQQTVSFGLALRTQFFIRNVERNKQVPAFDPDALLHKIFFDGEGGLDGFQLGEEDNHHDVDEVMTRHIKSIRTSFRRSSKNPVDLAQLRKNNPWQDLLVQASEWVSLRRRKVESQIRAQGGVQVIQQKLEENDFTSFPEVSKTYGQKSGNKVSRSTPEPKPRAGALDLKERMLRAKRFKIIKTRDERREGSEENENSDGSEDGSHVMQHPTTSFASPVTGQKSVMTEIPQTPDVAIAQQTTSNFLANDDTDERAEIEPARQAEAARTETPLRPTQSSIIPTQQTQAVLEVARQQDRISNKENINTMRRGFNDRQPNARRMQWADSQTGQKRSRGESDEEEHDQNDDFETDTRPQKRSRVQRPQPAHAVDEFLESNVEDDAIDDGSQGRQRDEDGPSTRPPPSAQPPAAAPPTTSTSLPSSSHPQHNRSQSHNRPTSHRSPSRHKTTYSEQPPDLELSPASQHRQVNQSARATMQKVSVRTGTQPAYTRTTQTRRAWTPNEINRLFDMIADHGCAWSRILKEDEDHPDGACLQQRTQVQLKDKARNLKMDYLKSGSELPLGFHDVTIKSVDKELLDSLGLPYQ